ncbi:MAG TPA: GxxExxY protein [Anaerolineales bacterium]
MTELLYKEQTFSVIGAAMEVHKILGPGFLEAVYQAALERELALREIPFEAIVKLPVVYKDVTVGIHEADIVVDNKFILELKSISKLNASHQAQAIQQGFALRSCSISAQALLNIAESSNKTKEKISDHP